MADDKDRLGNKLRDVEAAREDLWAKKLDEELLLKLRDKQAAAMHCPRCNKSLAPRVQGGVAFMACPDAHGAWLDADALCAVIKAGK
ncbi:MAG: zf-TFIIB domain-containing protein [Candidatus Binataceae bacterium]